MASSASSFMNNRYVNPARIRTYILRLPLCTRLLLAVMVGFWVGSVVLPGEREWASLIPSQIGLASMHRLNTYPFLHSGLIHLVMNLLAITSLLERFEAEYGTLVTLLLFTGPFATLPGALYTLTTYYVLRTDIPIMGSSIWVFLLLSFYTIHPTPNTPNPTAATIPLGPYRMPTVLTPLLLILCTSFLIPSSSLLGHLCGAAVGYGTGAGAIKYLLPPERILRWLEQKLNLLGRLPHYVSVDQKTYGRYGVLPSSSAASAGPETGPTLRFQREERRVV